MTLLEIVDAVGRDDAVACYLAIAQILRSALQGEPATFEGSCGSLVALNERFPQYSPPSRQRLERWIHDMPQLFAMDIPDALVAMAVSGLD